MNIGVVGNDDGGNDDGVLMIPGELIYIIIKYAKSRVDCLLVCRGWLRAFREYCDIIPEILNINSFRGYAKCKKTVLHTPGLLQILFNKLHFYCKNVDLQLTPEKFLQYVDDSQLLINDLLTKSDENVIEYFKSACNNVNYDAIRILLDHPGVTSDMINESVHNIVVHQNEKCYSLIKSHAKYNSKTPIALIYAIAMNDNETARAILTTPGGAYDNLDLAYGAIEYKNTEILKLLLYSGSFSLDGINDLLDEAIVRNSIKSVEIIIDYCKKNNLEVSGDYQGCNVKMFMLLRGLLV